VNRVSGDGGRSIYVEIEVSHPDLPLAAFVQALPGTTLELEYQRSTGSDAGVFLVVEGVEPAAADAALAAAPTVEEVLPLGAAGSRLVYRVTLADCVDLLPPDATDLGIRVLEIANREGAWRLKLHCPDRSVLEALRNHYHDHDVPFRIKRLHEAVDTHDSPDVSLSAVHRQTLTTAYRAGYFDVPRGITQGELADQLGLSRSGLSQRLRRATAKLVEQLVLD
jgi:predicted DNA binding protein